jgi:uncharacterized protein YdhG (YjbR/CyaY superfamily)
MKSGSAQIATIDEYIREFPRDVQRKLARLRATIRRAAPADTVEKISYRMPTFYYKRNLVHFAAYAHHIGFYPAASGVAAFRDELGEYATSKGAIQFPIDEPLPLDLVTRIVKFRAAENFGRSANAKKTATKQPAREAR